MSCGGCLILIVWTGLLCTVIMITYVLSYISDIVSSVGPVYDDNYKTMLPMAFPAMMGKSTELVMLGFVVLLWSAMSTSSCPPYLHHIHIKSTHALLV